MSGKVLVTGAAGFIGSHVVRDLMDEGEEVRAMIFPGEDTRNLEGVDVERVEGDVRDRSSVKSAVKGCKAVFHLAAIYALWLPRMSVMEEVNVDGTYNVMRECFDAGVERVVHTSSLVVFAGQSVEHDSNERSPFSFARSGNLYANTKYRSQQIALEFFRKGLDVVIAAPCGPFGPNDVQPTPTGRLLLSLVNLPVVALVDSINNMVDVRDVSKGHVLAWKKGRSGEAYILGNENMWAHELARLACEIAGINKPMIRVPTPLLKVAARFMLAWSEYVSKKPPIMDPSAVEIGAKGQRMDCSKAIDELGLPQRPIRESVRDSLVWFAKNGYITDKNAEKNILSKHDN